MSYALLSYILKVKIYIWGSVDSWGGLYSNNDWPIEWSTVLLHEKSKHPLWKIYYKPSTEGVSTPSGIAN